MNKSLNKYTVLFSCSNVILIIICKQNNPLQLAFFSVSIFFEVYSYGYFRNNNLHFIDPYLPDTVLSTLLLTDNPDKVTSSSF